ncbi:hypothetical protein F5Y15DRAFT_375636 [Xylariaceae sp. FL0016]|nr:hypothetical protein F5Y15DRAFT_375636 [Xylariaceae sp. FL0016]
MYSVLTSAGVYVIEIIHTVKGEARGAERLTQVRYRDMVADNYVEAGGDLKSLRFLGWHDIVNEAARQALKSVFRDSNKDLLVRGKLSLTPRDDKFEQFMKSKPLTNGAQSFVANLARDNGPVSIKRLVLIPEGFNRPSSRSDDKPVLHLVMEIDQPNGGQYGFETGTAQMHMLDSSNKRLTIHTKTKKSYLTGTR